MAGVLVIRPSSLGDVVHALPIVADLAEHAPAHAVDWVAEEAFAPLARLHPGIRCVIPVALRRWRHHLLGRGVWHEFAAFARALRRDRYDAILDLQEQMKGALLARLARGRRHGFDRHTVREVASTFFHQRHHHVPRTLHFAQRCRALAGMALGYTPLGAPRYGLVPPPRANAALPPRRFAVCVHVTSRDDKRWPDASWHLLLDALDDAGLAALLPWGSPGERERSEALARGHANAIVPAHHPLPDMAALLHAAKIVVGVDTGLVHLAAALGTRTVAVFTTTDAALAGVSIAGGHAVDLGGNGRVPSAAEVVRAMHELLLT